jgi:hypothetical protein
MLGAMRSIVLAAVFALAATVPASSAPATSPLEISISTDKATYAKGDDIALTVALHNRGTVPLTLVHPDYWGVSEIAITDSHGHAVAPQSFKTERKAVTELMTIPAGATKTHRFEKLTTYACCYADSFFPLPPGRYQITVRFANPPVKVKPPAGWHSDWTGSLTSAPVTIEVR